MVNLFVPKLFTGAKKNIPATGYILKIFTARRRILEHLQIAQKIEAVYHLQ